MTLDPIVATIDIDVPIAVVFDTMTSESAVPNWLGCLNYRREVGTTFHMQPDPQKRAVGDLTGATHCDVTAIDPPRRLAFTWYVPGTPKTTVTISLDAIAQNRTRATLIHEGWDQFPPEMVRPFHEQLKGGWSGGVLPSLKRVSEQRN